MKHAVYAPPYHDYGDPARLVRLAVEAEAAGFDGFFVWDHLALEPGGALDVVDATVVLGAIAQATERVRLGAMITPVARRRPWKLAKELTTLDHLSGGRVVLGVGLGEPAEVEYAAFGEDPTALTRARRLDEGLAILDPLLRGEAVTHDGTHYQLRGARVAPPCVQKPRLPIWAAASLPAHAGLRRAARLDGVFPVVVPRVIREGTVAKAKWPEWWPGPEDLAGALSVVRSHRRGEGAHPFEAVATGSTLTDSAAEAREKLAAFGAAGATWWFEWIDDAPGSFETALELVRRGPVQP